MIVNQWLETGKVLGAEASRLSLQAINQLLKTNSAISLTGSDLRVLGVSLLAGLVLLVVLLIVDRWWFGSRKAGKVLRIFLIILVTGLVILFHIGYQLTIGRQSLEKEAIEVRQPQQIEIKRLTTDVVLVSWETKRKTVGGVLWGYSPEHLDNLVLSDQGSQDELKHRAVIDVEPDQSVFLVIISNGYKYLDQGEAYQIGVGSDYQLEPIEPINIEKKDEN